MYEVAMHFVHKENFLLHTRPNLNFGSLCIITQFEEKTFLPGHISLFGASNLKILRSLPPICTN
jgi:hypothetical protein